MPVQSKVSSVPAAIPTPDDQTGVESGKGCLMLTLVCVACLVLMLAVILIFGDAAV